MEFIRKNSSFIKICIAILCLASFLMIFGYQVQYADRYGIAYNFSSMFTGYNYESSTYFIWSFVGYLLIFMALGTLSISIYKNFVGKRSGYLDLVSLILIFLGAVLIGFVALFFRESIIANYCTSYDCASSYRKETFTLGSSSMTAVILAGISFICLIVLMCANKKPKEDKKEVKDESSSDAEINEATLNESEEVNHHLVSVIVKAVLAVLCLVSFFMLFTDQATQIYTYRSTETISEISFGQAFFYLGFNSLASFFGYLILFAAATLLTISAYRSYSDKDTKWLDISSIVLMIVGLCLIAFVGIMLRESLIEYACAAYKDCAYSYRHDYNIKPGTGPIFAIIFTGISIVGMIILLTLSSRRNKETENKDTKEVAENK